MVPGRTEGGRLRPGTRARPSRGRPPRREPRAARGSAQRGPVRRLTSRSSATRTTTRMTSGRARARLRPEEQHAGPHHRAEDEDRGEDAPPRRDVAPAVGADDDGEEQGGPGRGPRRRGPARAAQALRAPRRVPRRSRRSTPRRPGSRRGRPGWPSSARPGAPGPRRARGGPSSRSAASTHTHLRRRVRWRGAVRRRWELASDRYDPAGAGLSDVRGSARRLWRTRPPLDHEAADGDRQLGSAAARRCRG